MRLKVASAQNKQGLTTKEQGDLDIAIQLFQKALDIFSEILSIVQSTRILHRSELSRGCCCCESVAVKIRGRLLGDNHIDTKEDGSA